MPSSLIRNDTKVFILGELQLKTCVFIQFLSIFTYSMINFKKTKMRAVYLKNSTAMTTEKNYFTLCINWFRSQISGDCALLYTYYTDKVNSASLLSFFLKWCFFSSLKCLPRYHCISPRSVFWRHATAIFS